MRKSMLELLDVSSPRVKLEDFFLRIVEEAQAAKIVTSGARLGGDVPEFLNKATQSGTDSVVTSLVDAAELELRSEPVEAPPDNALPVPSGIPAVMATTLGSCSISWIIASA